MTDQAHPAAWPRSRKTASVGALAEQDMVTGRPRLTSLVNSGVILRAGIVALVLGTALTLVNEPDVIFGDDAVQILPLLLVYITPFIVVTLSQILATRRAYTDAQRVAVLPRESFAATALSHAIPLRSVVMGLIVGSLNTSITVFTMLLEGADIADMPTALIGQAFVLPMLFGLLSQTISYRRAARRIVAQLETQSTKPREEKMRFISIIALVISAFALFTFSQHSTVRAESAPSAIAEGFPVPPLHPGGAVLETRELAPGVYALVSNKPPTDNSGFVVGEKGVLVIDAHIDGAMARQIQARVREVTDKPILYLVNTNYHGDHTFGNYAFPEATQIVAHRLTAERMKDFEHEKILMLAAVDNDATILQGTRLRLPDITFDETMRIDLGGRVVELHHFGAGNTPGDTVVYVPEARTAWTGNLVLGEAIIPFLIEGGAADYLATLARFAQSVDARTIIPGHAMPTTGAALGRYLAYLNDLVLMARGARLQGHTLEQTLQGNALPAAYVIPADSPLAPFGEFNTALHRWNLRVTYGELSGG